MCVDLRVDMHANMRAYVCVDKRTGMCMDIRLVHAFVRACVHASLRACVQYPHMHTNTLAMPLGDADVSLYRIGTLARPYRGAAA